MKQFIAFKLFAIAALAAAGAEASETQTTQGSFVLFDRPDHVASGCDVATQMHVGEVDKAGEVTVVLHNVVFGSCRIAVEPEIRTYKVSVRDIECGSRVFRGVRKHETGTDELEITDHRSRQCRDIPAAQLEVREILPAGNFKELFAPRIGGTDPRAF